MSDPLAQFSPATQAWFTSSFAAPTAAQAGAWQAIGAGSHTLVVAPTGSGKTLSAFLWALDRLASGPLPTDPLQRCRVLYVSPLKALAVDVERNLRGPLIGIGHAAARLSLPLTEVTIGVRSGDTPAAQRRAFAKAPPDVLITTPESLFLLLTSQARQALAGVETVIIDEIHSVAGSKRGAHLALSMERLDALLAKPTQRVGLSATVRPVSEIARYLAGGRPVSVVQPPASKKFELSVIVPVADLSAMGEVTEDPTVPADPKRSSIWPHLEERLVDLITDHTSTLVFANSRRLAERLTTRLNEVWAQRQGLPAAPQTVPATLMAAAGTGWGAPPDLVRAHHGSVSKEQRSLIEEDLKAGRLPAVVATSSLELGIDMGAIDLVVQVESPPSVASGLQRVGRAGHQVGAVSCGMLFPKFRGDLVQTAVVVECMRAGEIESLRIPSNPLDVLCQQIVAMCALDDWPVEQVAALCARTASFASLPPAILTAVLDLLAGRYPSEQFGELRPRIVWDRELGLLTGRRGAQRLAVTSGGTIPDRGLYGVFLAGGEGPGRRVGELDEEMVYESRVGDVFTLGTSSWRIQEITPHQVLVTPAPGQPGKLPFWHGDTLGRPAELGRAVGAFIREVGALTPAAARARVSAAGCDQWAADNLLAYLEEQRTATGQLPDDRTLIVERFRDELGDWRVVVHSPFGSQVHAPWALAVAARMRARYGVDVQAMHGDDGLVIRLPDVEWGENGAAPADIIECLVLAPDEVEAAVTTQIGGSALFAARFRECAGRALLLPRRRPGQRQPLWQQRQRSSQLLEVAREFPDFPIILETVRECLQDVFDVPGLVDLMRSLQDRQIRILELETPQPSPFARSLLFGYVAQFLYEGDSPLAERRAAALALDPTLLAELLGQGDGTALRDLLDPDELVRTEAELQHLTAGRTARDHEDLADLLRVLGPLSTSEIHARSASQDHATVQEWLTQLTRARRIIEVRIDSQPHWAAIEDAGRLRDALGTALPPGLPEAFLQSVADPLAELLGRYARTRGPFTVAEASARFGLGPAIVGACLRRLVGSGRLVEGELRPGGLGLELCDAEVLRVLRRRSLAALRQQVEPVPTRDLARFLPSWQGVTSTPHRGTAALIRAIEQLGGAALPASAWEATVLPARVGGYVPAMLDELTAAGEVLWCGHASLPGGDGWVSLHLADTAPLTLPDLAELELTPIHQHLLAAVGGGGGFFFRELLARIAAERAAEDLAAPTSADVLTGIWDLVWAGRLTGDTLAPIRAQLGARRATPTAGRVPVGGSARTGVGGPRPRRPRMGRGAGLERTALASGPPTAAGRWAVLPPLDPSPTARAAALAEGLLDRHGVVTRGAVAAENIPGGFAAVYRVLSAFEDAGRIRRGYYIEGLGAAQFALPGVVDRLRAPGATPTLILAATDPANPFGGAMPWPTGGDGSHRPGRKAGANVVLADGALLAYLERGGKSLLTFTEAPEQLTAIATTLASAVARLGPIMLERVDGADILGADHPLEPALRAAGFHPTTRGYRLRP